MLNELRLEIYQNICVRKSPVNAWSKTRSGLNYKASTGYGGPINSLLSWNPLGPVSRMNYSAFLYHLLVMTIVAQNIRSTVLYDDYFMAMSFCGLLLITYGSAFLATLWFEMPFVALEKLIFRWCFFLMRSIKLICWNQYSIVSQCFLSVILPFYHTFPMCYHHL